MTLLRQGSVLGESPYYFGLDGDAHGPSIRELLPRMDRGATGIRALDPAGLRQYFDRRPDGERTCLRQVKRLPAGSDLHREGGALRVRPRAPVAANGPLLPLLECVVGDLLARASRPVVALSGGLDSALVLALVRRLAGDTVPVITLATEFPGYCERAQTVETAHALGTNSLAIVPADAADFVDALPDTIAACETPLFNLHPVSKLLLARAAVERGHDALLTGDGADQVFAGADARNYVPIVGALVRATGLSLLSPFFDPRVAAWTSGHERDAEKSALRHAASAVLPVELAWRRKNPRLAPDFDVNHHRDTELETRLAPLLAQPVPDFGLGPDQTLWATTAILVRHIGGAC